MKLKNLYNKLVEGKQVGTLYHFTDIRGLMGILKTDTLKATNQISEFEEVSAVSFTRNKNFDNRKMNNGKGRKIGTVIQVVLEIDGDKLSDRYKIRPFDYYQNGHDITDKDSKKGLFHSGIHDEQEERIVGKDVRNATKYITKITFVDFGINSLSQMIRWKDELAQQYNIPVELKSKWAEPTT